MTNFLIAIGILIFAVACIYGIEWAVARRKPRFPLADRNFWLAAIIATDFGFVLLFLPVLLFVLVAFLLITVGYVIGLIFGLERAKTWIGSAFFWMTAMLLKVTSYRVVKPPQT